MIFRTIYAIQKMWQLRMQLKCYVNDTNLQLSSVLALSPQYLHAQGIKSLVLDYDGVLAAHGKPEPRADVIAWLHQMVAGFAPNLIYILSNQPKPERIDFFKQNFPQIVFVVAARKKPYPDGLQQIIALSGVPAAQIMLIDDRLGTGILAALIAGVAALWITHPYKDLRNTPLAESGFILLRGLEQLIVKILPS